MNSDSYSAFRAAGAFGDIDYEPDEISAAPLLRCSKCGCFVSAKSPSVERYKEEPDFFDPDYGGYIPGRPVAEVVTWPCRRNGCGGCAQETYYL